MTSYTKCGSHFHLCLYCFGWVCGYSTLSQDHDDHREDKIKTEIDIQVLSKITLVTATTES